MGLLHDLVQGVIVADDPDALADHVVDEWHALRIGGTLGEALGLTPDEDKAWGSFGASFKLLIQWRREGWPSTCGLCGSAIGGDNWAVFRTNSGEQVLTHLSCWSTATKARLKLKKSQKSSGD